jgi:anti-sigma factor RsiW
VTTSANDADRVPDLLLEQYRLGELPGDAAERLARRLAGDPDLRARLDALDRSDEEIHRQYPPEWLAERVRARRAAQRPAAARPRAAGSRWWMPLAVATTALVAIVFTARVIGPPPGAPLADPAEHVTLKGSGPGLALFRRTAEGSEPLAEGDVARPGELVRVGYRAAGRSHGVIVSIDGRGAVTRHLPIEGDAAAVLDRNGLVLLDHAYELDDAPRWEAFYFVTADAPFAVAPVLAAARDAAARATGASPPAMALPADLRQTVFLLRKEDTP